MKVLSTIALIFSSYALMASPSATELWVKNYVATSCVSKTDAPEPTVITIYNEQGEEDTVKFNWCVSTNLALRVTQSNVDGMSVGDTFAQIENKRFYNATNDACSYINGSIELVRYTFTGAVDRVVGNVTNRVWLGTNYIFSVVYRAAIKGVVYKSFETSPGAYVFQPEITGQNTNTVFSASIVKISDITRKKIITPIVTTTKYGPEPTKRRFSFFELFFPSAYAVSPGSLLGPINTRKNPPYPELNEPYVIEGLYYRYYYTDANDAKSYTLGEIEWIDSHGESATYEVDAELFKIEAGIEISSMGLFERDQGVDEDAVKEILKSKLPTARYNQLTRGSAWPSVLEKVNQIAKEFIDAWNGCRNQQSKYNPYPEEVWKEIGEGANMCVSPIWTGTCGSWACERCGLGPANHYNEDGTTGGFDLPTEHRYDSAADRCDVCINRAGSHRCGYRPPELEHHRGWENDWVDGGNKCCCECSHVKGRGYILPHLDPHSADKYKVGSDENCYRVWTCARCKELIDFDGIPNINNPGCTATLANHSFSSGGVFSQFVTNGVNMCQADYICSHNLDPEPLNAEGCGHSVVELLSHDPYEEYQTVSEIADDDDFHEVKIPCSHGYDSENPTTPPWCGYYFVMTNRHHYAFGPWANPGKVGDPIKPPDSQYHYSYRSCRDSDGTFDGKETCGHIHITDKRPHTWDLRSYENPGPTSHEVYDKCSACQYKKYVGREPHVNDYTKCYFLNYDTHAISGRCARVGCEAWNLIAITNHVLIGIMSYIDNEAGEHYVYDKCSSGDGCGRNIFIRSEPHFPSSDHPVITRYVASPNRTHDCYTRCAARGATSCTAEFCFTNEPCYLDNASQITLVDDPDTPDYYKCAVCTNKFKEVLHHWAFTSERHRCVNGASHLEGAHTLVNGACYCGFTTNCLEEFEYKEVESAIWCKSNDCYGDIGLMRRRYMTNGVVIAESERGEWIVEPGIVKHGNCKYNEDGFCRCPYCRGDSNLIFTSCYCPHLREPGTLLKFLSDVLDEYYFREWEATPYLWIDGTDPVFHVGNRCFQEAFISMPNLLLVDMSKTIDVGDYSFERAFTNCTRLSEVRFNALHDAGASAFEGAFIGCALNGGVNFASLEQIGTRCFMSAFAGSDISTIAFPALTGFSGVDSLAFFGSTVSYSMRTLSLPSLRDGEFGVPAIIDFTTMPNLVELNLKGASTNVVECIGDLSSLSKLKRIDLHMMTAIPRWTDSAHPNPHLVPTNSLNYMVVVPDALCEAWRSAEGWATVQEHIVPFSNQVIPTFINVSFDTDGADNVPTTNIVAGTGIVPPSNLIKFATSQGGLSDGGFIFNGWFIDEAKAIPYASGAPIDKNTTLYAKWFDNRTLTIPSSVDAHYLPDTGEHMIEFRVLHANIRLGEDVSRVLMQIDNVSATNVFSASIIRSYSETETDILAQGQFDPGVKIRLQHIGKDGRTVESDWATVRRED